MGGNMLDQITLFKIAIAVVAVLFCGLTFEMVLYYRLNKKLERILNFIKNASVTGSPVTFEEEETEETTDG
jgi:transposase